MVTLTLSNRFVRIEGAGRALMRKLVKATSYKVAGAHWAPAFRAGHWDGTEGLIRAIKGVYHAPAGLLTEIAAVLRGAGADYRLIDETCVRHQRVELPWNPQVRLRPYQLAAVRAVLQGPHPGVGSLKMPIRSGKTKTAAKVIRQIGRPAIFLVPSKMLLEQTIRSLSECLPGVEVGKIGDGVFDPRFITVATLQTVSRLCGGTRDKKTGKVKRPDPRWAELSKMFDTLVVDEVHHITGEGDWKTAVLSFDCRFRLGLSATLFPTVESEAGRGIIWAKALCGPIRKAVETTELVAGGYLMKQHVKMYRVTRPDLGKRGWSQSLAAKAITQNPHRNGLIARLAAEHAARGLKVIIISSRLDQISCLSRLIDEAGVDFRVLTGKDSADVRESTVDGLVAGDYNVLIGTVIGEGVDIPSVEVAINAEGGKDPKQAIQRQRNLTVAEGKTTALFIDFMDETNEYFRAHSKARLEAYRSEPSYVVEIVDETT